nr:4-oxalocrotonate tautomerase [Sedimentibacter sp.]
MPIIQVEMLKGRSVEQKRAMVEKITQVMVDTVDCKKEAVRIIIRDMEHENFAISGVLKCDNE